FFFVINKGYLLLVINRQIVRRYHTGSSVTNNYDFSIDPVIVFDDADTMKEDVLNEVKGKAGVYRWVHKKSNKSYVGSSVNLHARFKNYYRPKYISEHGANMAINRALLKYGYSEFRRSARRFYNIVK
uniref:homing endonuclease n=1 Tax=Leptographium wingfieldii TaxID=155675 RepID=UPI0023F0C325